MSKKINNRDGKFGVRALFLIIIVTSSVAWSTQGVLPSYTTAGASQREPVTKVASLDKNEIQPSSRKGTSEEELKAEDPSLLGILEETMNREMAVLQKEEVPPYYLNYRVNEYEHDHIMASFGELTKSFNHKGRTLTVMVRVGSHDLDNFHELREQFGNGSLNNSSSLPITNEPLALQQFLWKATNKAYRIALDKFAIVKANVAVKVEEEDQSSDFSKESKVAYYEPSLTEEQKSFDKIDWEEKVRKYSRLFLAEPLINDGYASISFEMERKYFVSTEGFRSTQNRILASVYVGGTVKADDGMDLPLHKNYFAYDINDLPDDETIIKDVKEIVEKLKMLREAPVVGPYAGPALLSGSSAAVFFHEIFGHRIEGHRLKRESDAQTFKKKLGEKVLPEHLTVYMDPTIKSYKDMDLNGYYKIDDEGIEGKRIVIVENGMLKGFLMSRSPIEGFPDSNGHGRANAGYQPVSRQSNLIVETAKPYTELELKTMLLDEAKRQNLEYAYYFRNVQGGFTLTGRYIPNSFNVMPVEVYRIYVDGQADELVRGVDLIGTPLAVFSEIKAAGQKYETFNGTCGAESGSVPVAAVAPTLYVNKIELQKKYKSQERPPILPRPDADPLNY